MYHEISLVSEQGSNCWSWNNEKNKFLVWSKKVLDQSKFFGLSKTFWTRVKKPSFRSRDRIVDPGEVKKNRRSSRFFGPKWFSVWSKLVLDQSNFFATYPNFFWHRSIWSIPKSFGSVPPKNGPVQSNFGISENFPFIKKEYRLFWIGVTHNFVN